MGTLSAAAKHRNFTELRGAIALAIVAMAWQNAETANVQTTFSYRSSVSSDVGGPLDLFAELNYDNNATDAPIAVVMHGFSGANGHFANVRANAQRLRDAGFFAISVAMRGREGSDGIRDSGGLELYDIYDAVEAVKDQFPTKVDPTNVHITGYSGGGGNVMSALTKFPDYFRVGSSFFGISDYGYDPSIGWYQNTASSSHQSQLNADIGNPLTGGPTVVDRYMARASNLAARNNPYSEIHLFVNSNEAVCLPIHNVSYRENAITEAAFAGEFDKIQVHVGNAAAPTYQDFDGDMVNDPNELQWWPHGYPTANEQAAGEGWYLGRLLSGEIPEPVLNSSDEFFVAGFVKTKAFELRIGNGQNGAGVLEYDLTPEEKEFQLSIESSNQAIGNSLWIDTADMGGGKVDVFLNETYRETINSGGVYRTTLLTHGSTLSLRLAVPGDYNKDGAVDLLDYQSWRTAFGSTSQKLADGNESGFIDAADFVFWRDRVGGTVSALQTSFVPEPGVIGHAAACLLAVFLWRPIFGGFPHI